MTRFSDTDGDSPSRGEVLSRDRGAYPLRPYTNGRRRDGSYALSRPVEPPQTASDLGKYVRILRERWKSILAAFVIITGGVTVGTAFKDPVYRATGTIEIRKQAAEVVPVETMFQFERISDQYLQTQYTMLRSPTLIRRTLSDALVSAKMPARAVSDSGASDEERLNAQIQSVRSRLSVNPVEGSRIVRVSFEAHDPLLSATFVNALIAQYIAMREEAGAAALSALDEQAHAARTQVLAAEQQLQAFVRSNGLGIIVGADGDVQNVPHERLRRLQEELTRAEAEGFQVEAQYDANQEQTRAAVDSDLLRTLRGRIAELQGEYARLRSTFTDSFPRARQVRNQLAQLDSLVGLEQARVNAALGSQHRASRRRSELLREAVNEQRLLLDTLSSKIAEYERLKRDLDGHKLLYAGLQQKRKEASVSAALAMMDVALLDPAVPPGSPVRPSPRRDIPFGALAGLIFGLGLAFLRHHTDTTVRTHEEVEHLSDVPLLALIPSLRVPRVPAPATAWIEADSAAEAFRGLRTSVLFEAGGPLPRTLLVTSTTPREGKTFVSANLAMSLAMLRRKVLLVDADLRRPSLHHVFKLSIKGGLSGHLAGEIPWQEAIHRDVRPGLDVMPSQADSHNPADLLSSPAARRFITEATAAYDFVVFDAPALFINVPDARILAQTVEGVLFVVRSGATPRDLVQRLLEHTPNLVGVVLNGVDLRGLPEYYRDYATVGAGDKA
jgi:succinoglycan biosynthesis transport protein ExoP